MQRDALRQWLNLCFAVAMPVVAGLATWEITGPAIGAISDRYPTYVVPAGYAFTIWSLIYVLALGYGVWQARPAQRENPLLRRLGWFSASAFLATSVWVLVFQQFWFGASVAVMLWLLVSLIGVVVRLYRYDAHLLLPERWLVYLHFSLFLGWVTVATVANIGQTLTAQGWAGWGIAAETWGVVALAVTGLTAMLVTVATNGNLPYALTVIWALAAIAVKQFSQASVTSSVTVGLVASGMVLLIGVTLLFSRQRQTAWRSGFQTSLRT